MSNATAGSAERDARDLNRGLAVNLLGYALKIGHPLLLIWVVRAFGAEAWGQYTVSEAVLLIVVRVVLLGFDKTLLWWVPRMDSEPSALPRLRGALWGTLILSFVSAGLISWLLAGPIAAWRGAPEAATALSWMAWTLVPMSVMELFISAALGKRKVESHVLIRDLLVSFSFVGLALVLFYAGLRETGLAIAYFVSYAIGAVAASVVFVRLFGIAGAIGGWQRPSREMVRYALPQWGGELLSTAMARADVLAVSYWGSPAAVGVYGIVMRVGNAVRSVRRSYDPIVTALMSDIAASGDKNRLREGFSRATVLVMLTQVPIFAVLALFANELMPLFGEGFEQATVPVIVICAFWIMNGAIGMNGFIVAGFGRSDLLLLDLSLMAVYQGVALALLVPPYGAVGASVAVGSAHVLANLLQAVQGNKLSGINPYNRDVMRAVVASLGAFAAAGLVILLAQPLGSWPSRVLGTVVFGLVLWLAGWAPIMITRAKPGKVGRRER
jgi:O-antigen/teichoic acid export membrane protein